MPSQQQALIEVYLQDEMKLYQDWYATVQPTMADPDTTPFGINDSLAELKQRFIVWWQTSIETDAHWKYQHSRRLWSDRFW